MLKKEKVIGLSLHVLPGIINNIKTDDRNVIKDVSVQSESDRL